MKIYNKLLVSFTLILAIFAPQVSADYRLPHYDKVVLENGLTLYLMEQKEVPLIDVSLVVKTGAVNDNDQMGIAYLTGKSLPLGTEKNTKSQIDKAFDFIGANLFSFANTEFTTLGVSFANYNTDQALSLFQEIALSPSFDQAEFTKFKKRHLLKLEQNKESPKSVINQYFNRLIFGDSGYGTLVQGDETSIQALTINHVKSFYKQWYQPNNAALIVVGDFDKTKMKSALTQHFGSWKNTTTPNPIVFSPVPAPKAPKVLLVNKADAKESTFIIGGKGITRNNPDLVGLTVINTILGGRFTSWLNDELRVNAGLTYGARSRFATYSQDGSFQISTFTKTDTTIEAIDLALKTYKKLWQKGLDQATLDSAKAYVKGQFPPRYETSSNLATLLSNMYGYNIDDSYINTFEQQVNSLTLKKAQALIEQYFPQNNLQIVVIGKADEINEKLEKYGNVKQIEIEADGFNIAN